MAYLLHFELWPVFCPILFELVCIIYLACLKIYYEIIAPKAAAPTADGNRVGRQSTVQAELKAPLTGATSTGGGSLLSPLG